MNRIVVGVDTSPSGAAALEWALNEAVSTGAAVHAVRAWTYSAYAAEAYVYATPSVDPLESTGAQAEADEQLALATARVVGADAVECTATAVFGTASQVLVEQAADGALLVVGSRSHSALSRAVLGSVSSSVLHHASGPVVVVPEPHEGDGAPSRVVVGVDHSPAALAALTVAVDAARRRGVRLVPVHVHQPMELPRGGAHPPDLALLESSEQHTLEAAAAAAGAADVDAQVLVGNPVVQLLATARPRTCSSSAPVAVAGSPGCCSGRPARRSRSTHRARSWSSGPDGGGTGRTRPPQDYPPARTATTRKGLAC